jgi:hypothetical protein
MFVRTNFGVFNSTNQGGTTEREYNGQETTSTTYS